jgi:hypothetical protein
METGFNSREKGYQGTLHSCFLFKNTIYTHRTRERDDGRGLCLIVKERKG